MNAMPSAADDAGDDPSRAPDTNDHDAGNRDDDRVGNSVDNRVGVVLIHGFTGTPASMQPIADELLRSNIAIEQPLLAGHGTEIADMVACTWDDWMADVAAATDRLSRRCDRLVLCGQSMGGALALGFALGRHGSSPDKVAGLVCINPLTQPRSADELEMIDELIEDGMEIAPGGESDIADPDAHDVGYTGTPLRAIRSVLVSGIGPMAGRYGEIQVPMRLYTSRHDHVVDPADSEYLADVYGGQVDHVWLERGYHVAAIDYDRAIIASGVVEFAHSVAG